MGRAPCCEKMGLKKGPWTPQEDQILISYIHQYGHGNWRALPKHAGLLRCGKSCRLRWTNYLRPDIKRGNFTREEEDAIINLHQTLGNRWSAIAARLPGRTDNEIKNVWHTHLKKRLCHLNSNNNISTKTQLAQPSKLPGIVHLPKKESPESAVSGPTDLHTDIRCSSGSSNNTCISTRTTTTTTAAAESSSSPQPSCSATSSTDTLTTTALKMIRDHHHQNTTTITNCDSIQGNNNNDNLSDDLLSEDFWAEVLSTENIIIDQSELPEHHHSPTSTNSMAGHDGDVVSGDEYCYYNNMDFYWYNLLTRAAETPPPPQPPHEFMEF